MNHALPILVYLFIALAVTRIPYLRVYFSLCNTLPREVIRVLLEGGIANRIKLHNTGAGPMMNIEHSRFKNTLVAYAGYTGESLTAIGLFYLLSNENYQFILYLFIGLMVVAALLWIRNLTDIFWVLSFVALLVLPIYFRYEIAIMHISIFLSSYLLVQSILNGIQVWRRSLLERKSPDRFGTFSRVKFIPGMMFGAVLLVQSLYAGYFIGKNILSFL